MTIVAAKDGQSVTVRIPFNIRKRGGRKLVLAPDGAASGMPRWARVDNTMVKAIGRAFRWRKLMEAGVHASVGEIAAAEKINPSYVSRVLRLTLLAPRIVEQILNGTQRTSLPLGLLMGPFPAAWEEQRDRFADVPQTGVGEDDPEDGFEFFAPVLRERK
jgi:hypothetical protein